MKIKQKITNGTIELDTSRFDSQLKKAQIRLNTLVVNDCEPYTPHLGGQLRNQTRFPKGIAGDEIEWYAPYAHYQYYGELYLAPNGSSWAHKGEVKSPAGRPLTYREPNTGAFWFETTKRNHKSEWLKEVRRIGGGGA